MEVGWELSKESEGDCLKWLRYDVRLPFSSRHGQGPNRAGGEWTLCSHLVLFSLEGGDKRVVRGG